MDKTALFETLKFVLRMALFIGLPIAISQIADMTGTLKQVFDIGLPVLLPIIDKWIHEDSRIPLKGITPF